MKKKFKKSRKNKDFIEIYGLHAVQAALNNVNRTHQKLIISTSLKEKFKNLDHKVNEIIFVPKHKFSKIYGKEKNHQGVILKTSNLEQPSIDYIIDKSII